MSVDMPFTDAALKKATGKDWQEWRTSLEEWGASERSYLEISRYLADAFGLNDWWAQGITVGYERMTARRSVGKLATGTHSASLTRVIDASIEQTHASLVTELRRYQWLADSVVRLRTSQAPKVARFDDYEAKVIITFSLTEEDGQTNVHLKADTFESEEAAAIWKSAWEPRLADLAEYVEQKVAT